MGSLNGNQLDEQIMKVIQSEGALSLITQRKEAEQPQGDVNDSVSKKYMSLRRRELKKTASLHNVNVPDEDEKPVKQKESKPEKKKAKEKSKDAETGVPSYSKFKFAFDSLLQ